MKHPLKGKVVFVTGASQGIGKATVEEFSKHHMKICLLSRSKPDLIALQTYVNDRGNESLIFPVDLNSATDTIEAVKKCTQVFGTPHFLLNIAGCGFRGHWIDFSFEEECEITRVNYVAAVNLIRQILPRMLELDRGHIINVNSLAGVYAAPYQGAYCASKAALLAYSSSLAHELKSTNVNISSILPGPVDTNFLQKDNYEGFKNSKELVSPEVIAKTIIQIIEHPKEFIYVGPSWKYLVAKLTNFNPVFRAIFEKKNSMPKKK